MVKITFSNTQQSVEVPLGTELKDVCRYIQESPLLFGCRQGQCGVCCVRIAKGIENLSRKTRQEKETLNSSLDPSCRLACQCAVLGDVEINPRE